MFIKFKNKVMPTMSLLLYFSGEYE
jgi:hypothetical protein